MIPSQKILAIVAMEAEMNSITEVLGSYDEKTLSPNLKIRARVFRSANGINEFCLVQSGIGLVNAALAASSALDREKFSAVILLGVAGALREDLEIGDLLVAQSVLQHDSLFSDEKGEHLMAPGSLYLTGPSSQRPSPFFECDKNLVQTLLESKKIFDSSKKIVTGCLVSGSRFEGNIKGKLNLAQIRDDVLAVDMEAAGVAQVALRAGIPFLVLKTIADRLSPAEGITEDYKKFLKQASLNAGLATRVFWNALLSKPSF